jgi:hypothetical protein
MHEGNRFPAREPGELALRPRVAADPPASFSFSRERDDSFAWIQVRCLRIWRDDRRSNQGVKEPQ